MTGNLAKLSRQYLAVLRNYIAREQEASLQRAYELGRKAIADGLGVWDVAKLHQGALAALLLPALTLEARARTIRAAETFFLESLSPFEATHRGFRDAFLKLQQSNKTLEQRNRELATLNQELESQMAERARMEEQLRHLSNRVLHAQEEERKRISRELHDEVGQALTAIDVNLQLLKKEAAVNEGLAAKMAQTQKLLQLTMESVHRFARELRPAMLDDLGFVPALRHYTKDVMNRTGIRIRFRPSLEAERLNDDQKMVLYRVAQESLTNVARHAQATCADVNMRPLKRGLRMEIKDNGKSFQVGQQLSVNGTKRLGLLGMRERVRLVNGDFAVESQPGRGTIVRVWIPFGPTEREDCLKRSRV